MLLLSNAFALHYKAKTNLSFIGTDHNFFEEFLID